MKAIAILITALAVATLHAEPQQHGRWHTMTYTDEFTDVVHDIAGTLSTSTSTRNAVMLHTLDTDLLMMTFDEFLAIDGRVTLRIDDHPAQSHEVSRDGDTFFIEFTDELVDQLRDSTRIIARFRTYSRSHNIEWSGEGTAEAFERFGWSVEQ